MLLSLKIHRSKRRAPAAIVKPLEPIAALKAGAEPVKKLKKSGRQASWEIDSCSGSRTKPVSHKFVFKDFFSEFLRCF
jgi:hypothetical protein